MNPISETADLPTEERDIAEAPETTFADLGLSPALVSVVASLGYEEPTPIQKAAIPVLLAGRDLLGLAATGTGKTAAFALPMLQRLERREGERGPFALVLVPTRELAMQVAEAVHKYSQGQRVRVLPVYGGAAMSLQLRALERGIDVVVATPGRALDHLRRGSLRLEAARFVVLDEADEMLDMGFQEDLEAILAEAPAERQMALFSATFPHHLKGIAKKALRDPVRLEIAAETVAPGELPKVRQVAYLVGRAHKRAALARILDMETPQSALVFCRTRTEVEELAESLDSRGYRAEALHGGLSQAQRDRVMQKLRAGTADLIVATDVAARGLDIGHLSHVINFDLPPSAEQYVHRIGRTGRAGREGVAITLAEPRERFQLRNVERMTGQRLSVESVPTVADLRARRLDLVRAQVSEAALAGDLDAFRRVVASMTEEIDVIDIAAAALKALHAATWVENDDEVEIPAGPPQRPNREDRRYDQQREEGGGRYDGPRDQGRDGGYRDQNYREAPRDPQRGGPRDERPRFERPREASFRQEQPRFEPPRSDGPRNDGPRSDGPRHDGPRNDGPRNEQPRGDFGAGQRPPPPPPTSRDGGFEWARLYIGLGRMAGVRPGDLFGAIVGETGLNSRAIGAIQITDRFSLVDVPAEVAEDVIRAMRSATLRGRPVVIRRDRGR